MIYNSGLQSFELGTAQQVLESSRQGCTFCTLIAIALGLCTFALKSETKDDVLFVYKDGKNDSLGCIQIHDIAVVREVELETHCMSEFLTCPVPNYSNPKLNIHLAESNRKLFALGGTTHSDSTKSLDDSQERKEL